MGKIINKRFSSIVLSLIFLLIVPSCRNRTKWFQLECSWKNNTYNFVIHTERFTAILVHEDTRYNFEYGVDNMGKTIEFNYPKEDQNNGVTEEDIVLAANTTWKYDILYLTFKKDTIADLLGKTLEFYKINN